MGRENVFFWPKKENREKIFLANACGGFKLMNPPP